MKSTLIFATIFVAVAIQPSVSDVVVHLKTKDDYMKFRDESIPQGIFYYHHDGTTELTSRTKTMIEELNDNLSDERRFMKFATLNCKAKGMGQIDVCKEKGNRKFFAYKPNTKPKRISLRQFTNSDALVALMINFVYEEEIAIISDKNEWNALQNEMKGKKDILFMYIRELGKDVDYAFKLHFLRYGVGDSSDMVYAYTQSNDIMAKLGGSLVYAKCSTTEGDSKDSCSIASTNNAEFYTRPESIDSFVGLQNMPNVVEFTDKNAQRLASMKDIYVLYVFVENEEQSNNAMKMTESLIDIYSGIVIKAVIVDRRTSSDVMSKEYGITASTMLPTAMLKFVLKKSSMSDEDEEDGEKSVDMGQTVHEPLTPDEDLTEESLGKFIDNIVSRKDEYFKSVADVFYINCVKSADWKDFNSIKRDTLIGFCASADPSCITFNQEFRRLVRTMYTGGLINIEYVHVDESTNHKLEMDLPLITFVLNGKVEHYDGAFNGENVLSWINGLLKMDLSLPPVSGTDLLHLPIQSNMDENGEITQGESEDLFSLQEDEVSRSTTKIRNVQFFSDETTLQLTDDTFAKTINMTEMLIAFFITPDGDDVSFLIQPLIKNINMELAKDSGVTVASVNCEMEYLTCKSIHSYPTIRFYSKGKLLSTYKGLLDKKNILNALKVHQQPHIEQIASDSLLNYQQPSIGLSIFGWFASENSDFEIYKKVADEYRGLAHFAYALGEAASRMLPELPESTLLSAFVGGKKSRSFNGGVDKFSEMGMREFLKTAAIPKFGELNFENFPVYKATGKPLFILFASGMKVKDSVAWNIITRVVKDDSLENQVFFTWMDTDSDINKDIRRSYLGTRKDKVADIVIVNHTKGEVYHYAGPQDDVDTCSQEVATWVRQCANGGVTAKSHLKVMNWKPLREGFDFLSLIDNDQIRAGLSRADYEKQRKADRENDKMEATNKEKLVMKSANNNKDDGVLKQSEELDKSERADAESEELFTPTETVDLGPNKILSENMPKEEL